MSTFEDIFGDAIRNAQKASLPPEERAKLQGHFARGVVEAARNDGKRSEAERVSRVVSLLGVSESTAKTAINGGI